MNDADKELDHKVAYLLANDGLIELENMLADERRNGMTGFSFTVAPDSTASPNEIARDIVKMHKAFKNHQFTVITDPDAP